MAEVEHVKKVVYENVKEYHAVIQQPNYLVNSAIQEKKKLIKSN